MRKDVDLQRRRILQLLALSPWLAGVVQARPAREWPAWQRFLAHGVSDDGRVIDHGEADRRTTSEGQSYALFFALVANDRARFETLLRWTRNNLAAGDLGKHLPAWLWGRSPAGAWQVLDANPAADADLWLAYVLLEASRLWHEPAWKSLAGELLAQVLAREVATLDGLGPMLLPAPQGFVNGSLTRLNPSYLPLPLLRRFAHAGLPGPWSAMAENFVRMLKAVTPLGYAPDWLGWQDGHAIVDPVTGAVGSYAAIRCYLWAGMLAHGDPLFTAQLHCLRGPLARLRTGQAMWELTDTRKGTGTGTAGAGFAAALLPYLDVQGESALGLRLLQGRAPSTPAGAPDYYTAMLQLFGSGWHEGRFRFAADGRLLPAWR